MRSAAISGSLSSPPSPIRIVASNTPIPAGVWLAKPSKVAAMKTAVIAEDLDIRPGRNQHVHRQRRRAEIENPDHDLQQHHRPGRKPDRPALCPDASGSKPAPGKEADNPEKQRGRQPSIDLRRQEVDHTDGIGRIKQAEPESRQIAQPEGEPGQKADIRHIERAKAVVRIDSITDDR